MRWDCRISNICSKLRPGRYCVHKLAVYSMRGSANPKGAKDLQQAAMLAAALAQENDFALADAIETASPTLRRRARAGAMAVIAMLGNEHAAATRQLEIL